jgi:hypothetical protein
MGLPHDPYISAVVTALAGAGLEPSQWWTDDAEIDPFKEGPDAGCTTMLSAVLAWDSGHPALTSDGPEHGVLLLWEHPAEEWQQAARHADRSNESPAFLPLGRYARPEAATAAVRALLSGRQPPAHAAPEWSGAGAVRAAVAAWEAE